MAKCAVLQSTAVVERIQGKDTRKGYKAKRTKKRRIQGKENEGAYKDTRKRERRSAQRSKCSRSTQADTHAKRTKGAAH